MPKYTIGVIGCGNMGGAIVRGMISNNVAAAETVLIFDKATQKADSLAKETGCVRKDLTSIAGEANILIIAVKPKDFDPLIGEISDSIKGDQVIISVAAGVTIESILNKFKKKLPE